MKRTILIAVLMGLLSGCVSTGDTTIAPVVYRLDAEISWSARPPIALDGTQTFYFPPGEYIASRRDSEGQYLVPPGGIYMVQFGNKKPTEAKGGIYLPDDPKKGINVFIYNPGGTTAVNGIIMNIPPSNKMMRMRLWGPSELVHSFKRMQ